MQGILVTYIPEEKRYRMELQGRTTYLDEETFQALYDQMKTADLEHRIANKEPLISTNWRFLSHKG